jgi:hypothetical protein
MKLLKGTNYVVSILFAVPIKNNTTPSIQITKIIVENINSHLKSIKDSLKINNIRADGDSKFGKMIEDNGGPKTIKLGKMYYKTNSFLKYLQSQSITLELLSIHKQKSSC